MIGTIIISVFAGMVVGSLIQLFIIAIGQRNHEEEAYEEGYRRGYHDAATHKEKRF